MDAIVSIRDLAVEFRTETGTTHALAGVNLDIARGRTTAIVGESGSGKSVTAFAMLRLIQSPGRTTSGTIEFRPRSGTPYDVLALPERDPLLYQHRGAHISMIFQEPMTALSPVHTIGNQVAEALLVHGVVSRSEAYDRAADMLERVGITDARNRLHQYPFEFSGGMRQRVVIAMALIANPELVICDEPTTALDVTVQAEILSLINDLKREFDMSVMFITHDLGVVAQVADHVVVMYGGRVLETGTVRQVLKTPMHPYTRGLLGAIPGVGDPGARLQTIDELVTADDLTTAHPLIELSDGRQIALPRSRIPGAAR